MCRRALDIVSSRAMQHALLTRCAAAMLARIEGQERLAGPVTLSNVIEKGCCAQLRPLAADMPTVHVALPCASSAATLQNCGHRRCVDLRLDMYRFWLAGRAMTDRSVAPCSLMLKDGMVYAELPSLLHITQRYAG